MTKLSLRYRLFIFAQIIFAAVCAQESVPGIAFPGAEGFGRSARGGRGGKVYIVTNLADAGPGSLREAAEARGTRMVVFNISGTIHLESPLHIKGDVTIAGQSAPGDGICIADHPVGLNGDNIIIRYLRFRLGDRFQNEGMVNGSGDDDALSGTRRKHIIIDHCSISWSTDECMSIYGGDSTSLQWNIISEPLNYSYHFETGDKDFERHGFGGIWGGVQLSAHHNLFAHCVSRTPRFNGARLGSSVDFVDFRNNVIYNWGGNNVYGGEAGQYNLVNNYYRFGPGTSSKVRNRIVNPTRNEQAGFGQFYVQGNCVDGFPEVSRNNKLGVHTGGSGTELSADAVLSINPFPAAPIWTETADDALQSVLKHSGASLHRDTLDQRIIQNVLQRSGRFIDVQGGYAHGTPYMQTTKAWPFLRTQDPAADADQDGMPDDWEKAHGLDPLKADDAHKIVPGSHYTFLELYLNSLCQ